MQKASILLKDHVVFDLPKIFSGASSLVFVQ